MFYSEHLVTVVNYLASKKTKDQQELKDYNCVIAYDSNVIEYYLNYL